MSAQPLSPLLSRLCAIAREAGDAILAVYHSDFSVQHKADDSPLTAADLAAQKVILRGLAALDEVLPVVSEEACAAQWAERQSWPRYWLVDPLDGTREFVKRNGEFTVNIALIDGHESVMGVVLAPVTGDLYAAERGRGAWRGGSGSDCWQALHTRALTTPAVVAGSRWHGDSTRALLYQLVGEGYEHLPLGSSLKFCLLARGAADAYLRLGPTSEWDTGAAHCVLREAGGEVMDLRGRPLRYNCGESLLNPEFLAVGDRIVDWTSRLGAASR